LTANVAADTRITGAIDLAHATRADAREDFVSPSFSPTESDIADEVYRECFSRIAPARRS
jgi:hypothetical protein